MITLKTAAGDFGPFRSAVLQGDVWLCDGVIYPVSVVGAAQTAQGAPEITPASPAVPQSVPMLNAHLILIADGKMTALLDLVASLPDDERLEATAYLNLAQSCRRDNKWVIQLGPELGYDSAGLDQLFIRGDALNP